MEQRLIIGFILESTSHVRVEIVESQFQSSSIIINKKCKEKCNAPIPNTEDNAKVPEVRALLPGKSENFQDRSLQ